MTSLFQKSPLSVIGVLLAVACAQAAALFVGCGSQEPLRAGGVDGSTVSCSSSNTACGVSDGGAASTQGPDSSAPDAGVIVVGSDASAGADASEDGAPASCAEWLGATSNASDA